MYPPPDMAQEQDGMYATLVSKQMIGHSHGHPT
jgi:hypothetical protein